MSIQLPLPAGWARQGVSLRDPADRLRNLQLDRGEARKRVREVLEWLAGRHGIAPRHVGDALEGYADDMLSDLVFFVEREIESEIDGGP